MGEVIKARKPKARRIDIVIGVIEERIAAMGDSFSTEIAEEIDSHVTRLAELLDELKRSLNRKENGDE